LPESPRWLDQHGRTAEAEKIVADLEHRIRADGVELAAPEPVTGETDRKAGAWAEMWNATYRGRTKAAATTFCSGVSSP
jgi:putative MFS transporter